MACLDEDQGEGVLKSVLPDAHTDFIFAVVGEEFGLITGLFLLALFAFVVLRCLSRALQATNPFVMLATTGLVVQFGLQAVINIGVNLDLMPTKGMTLPFISYGGSSLIGMALVIGDDPGLKPDSVLARAARPTLKHRRQLRRTRGSTCGASQHSAEHRYEPDCRARGRRHRRTPFSRGRAGR